MKISDFAGQNQVTTKMLRHYDEIGLLKPSAIDPVTGYRSYEADQAHILNWILILKNLEFSLAEIKVILKGPVHSGDLVHKLKDKRIGMTATMNDQLQKKIQMDRLINLLEKEEFRMDKQLDLLKLEKESVHELKKNMPSFEVLLESAQAILLTCADTDCISVLRFDIRHFKQVNDHYGFDVGDAVILACYEIIRESFAESGRDFALGRAHGDEFVGVAKAGKEEMYRIAQSVVKRVDGFDFHAVGCPETIGARIGFIYAEKGQITDIRRIIENTMETIYEAARPDSRFSVVSQSYR